jgi:hypothetical protein
MTKAVQMPKDSLQQLNQHLENTEAKDSAQQAGIDELKQHVQQGIDDPASHPDLLTRLEKAILLYEDDHPALAAAMRSAINVLSSGGM